MEAMSKTFIDGIMAEKARMANQLICELVAELSNDLILQHLPRLNQTSQILQEIQHKLRRQDEK
jgi:hypothetical protein